MLHWMIFQCGQQDLSHWSFPIASDYFIWKFNEVGLSQTANNVCLKSKDYFYLSYSRARKHHLPLPALMHRY